MGFPLVLKPGTVLREPWPSQGHTEATLIDKYVRAAADIAADMISNSNSHLLTTYYMRALCRALSMFNLNLILTIRCSLLTPLDKPETSGLESSETLLWSQSKSSWIWSRSQIHVISISAPPFSLLPATSQLHLQLFLGEQKSSERELERERQTAKRPKLKNMKASSVQTPGRRPPPPPPGRSPSLQPPGR